MVTATNNSQAASTTSFSIPTPTSAGSTTDAFAQELAQMIEGYLSQSGNGSGATTGTNQLNVSITQSQGELSVTVQQNPGTTSSSDSLMDTSNLTANASSNATATSSTAASTTSGTTGSTSTLTAAQLAQMTPDQAYWAGQPPAVQALQNMDPADRATAAMQLAQQGYTIDVPIMAWGWDPLTTMVERQNYGYTWVPSALQPMVPLAPGLSFPGLQSYDPTSPPAGSIPVTTAFAQGTNMQDVFIDPATIQASWANDPSTSTGQTTSQPTISA